MKFDINNITEMKMMHIKTGETIMKIDAIIGTAFEETPVEVAEQDKTVRLGYYSYKDCSSSYHDRCDKGLCRYAELVITNYCPTYFRCTRKDVSNGTDLL